MDVSHLNAYQYKQYLIEGDVYLQKLEEKEKRDEEAIRQIKIVGAKLRGGKNEFKKTQKVIDRRIRQKKYYIPAPKKVKKEITFLDTVQFKEDIKTNITENSHHDAIKIIEYLNGNKNSIWELFNKDGVDKFSFFLFKDGIFSRSTEMSIEDLILEGFMNKVIPAIDAGKYKGSSTFFSFACKRIKFYIIDYYKRNGVTVEYTKSNLFGYHNNRKGMR